MASSVEEMEVERPEPSTPTPAGKGKERQTQTGQAQITKSINEYLQAFGPGKNTPLVETIGGLTDDDLTEEGMTTMTLVLSLAQQVRTLSVNVQNLTLLIRDQSTPAGSVKILKRPDNENVAQTKTKGQAEPKSYAETLAADAQPQDPQTPKRRNRKRKGRAGPTPPQPPQAKVARDGEETSNAKEESHGWKTVGTTKTRATKMAKHKLFATRDTATPLADPTKEEAKIALALADILTQCGCKAPVNLQVSSNKVNGTITITTPAGTDSNQYIRYAEKMTETLNGTIGENDPKYLTFRRVPTDANLLVHGVFFDSIPDNNTDLSAFVKKQFAMSYKVDVTSAKFLKTEPAVQTPEKKACSIIVRVPEADATKFEPRFLFLGKYKEAKVMWHATPTTQCTRCWRYGHPRVGCKETNDTCPICSKAHREDDHKCRETECKGHKRLIANCCPMTPALCPVCKGAHSAKDKDCPEKVRVKEEEQRRYDQRMATLAEVGMEDPQN